MKVKDLHKQLEQMITSGMGDHEVVHIMGNGQEKSFCGFEVVVTGSFDQAPPGDARSSLDRSRAKRERELPRLRLFTHSPF